MAEIAAGVPPKVPNVSCFFLSPIQGGLSATYLPASISTIFETKDVNRCPHAYTSKKFQGFPRSKTAEMGTVDGAVFVIKVQLNFLRWESFQGLVDIPRMCLLCVSFAGKCTVLAMSPQKNPNFADRHGYCDVAENQHKSVCKMIPLL